MLVLLSVVLTSQIPIVGAIRVEEGSVGSQSSVDSGRSNRSHLGIGALDTEQCTTKVSQWYCCSTRGGKCKNKPERSVCDETKGMDCDWTFTGRVCTCESNHCFDEKTKSCVKKEELPVTVGPEKSRSTKSVKIEDMFKSIGSGVVETGEALGSGLGSLGEDALAVVTSPFREMGKKGALYFSGVFAGSALNSDLDSVEEWLQYVMSSFVLYHDDPTKSCNIKKGPFGIAGTKPDYGHCNFPLASEDGSPLWEGPLFPYSDGKGNDFNISLRVKAGQVRGLEALQVQSSRCFGNVVSNGGLCKLELAPSGKDEENLAVTDLEVEIFCEGKCSIQDQVLGVLSSDDAIEVGKHVYVYKEGSPRYGDKCKSEKHVITRNFVRCNREGKECLRHCLETVSGKNRGCWHGKNILTESQWKKECEGWVSRGAKFVARRLATWMGGTAESSNSRVTLLYRKFNAKLVDVKVRADVYIFRTRSLSEVVNKDEETKEDSSKTMLARTLDGAFGGISKALNVIAHPVAATSTQKELIEKYKFNLQPKKFPNGTVEGYELVTCSQFTWDEKAEDYSLPPLKKCQKIRIVNLELLANQADYLEVEEISSKQDQEKAVAGSPGIVLSIVAKLARMMFVRFAVKLQVPDDKDGSLKYCKDMWTKRDKKEKEHAVGILCKASDVLTKDPDEVGDGVDARYDFEVVELKPVWDELRKKNFQYVGLRGGYNLQFCRVLRVQDPETKLLPGSVVCDLDAPLEEGTQKLINGSLPEEARFRLEPIGKNNVPSTISIGGGSSSAEASCENCEEKAEETAKEEVDAELSDKADVDSELAIRLVSVTTNQYCRLRTQVFDGFFFDKKKKLLACDKIAPGPSDLDGHTELVLRLSGNTDGLVPSPYWNFIIVLSLSCVGASAGFTGGKWAALLGGAGMIATFTAVVGGTAAGAAAGYYITEYLSNNYHLDGIMLRYLLNMKMQALGQQILFAIESALDFELPRP